MIGAARPANQRAASTTPRAAAVDRLRAVGSTAVVGLVLVGVKAVTGRGVACPFRALTGWRCPLCGATTMGVDLAHGRLGDAWRQNQLCMVGLVGLLACCTWWCGVALGAASAGSTRQSGGVATQSRLYGVAAVVAVVWVLVRNLVPSLRAG